MKILYDSHIFLTHKAGGISRYHYELYKGIYESTHSVKLAGKFYKNQYLKEDKLLSKSLFYDPTASFSAVNKYLIKKSLKNKKAYDLYHPSNPYEYLFDEIPSDKKVVLTIHDMIPEKIYHESYEDKLKFANRADKIIAVSEATKKDVVDILGTAPDKIEVIYHGSSFRAEHADLVKNKPAGLPEKYVLYVGNRNDYKNFKGLVKAIVPLLKKDSSFYLVCAGKRFFSKKEQEFLQSLGVENKVLCYVGVDDNLLAYLYRHAKAFVFPSLNEGFGIPILEAWSCGTPVVLSENPCFLEVAEDAGFYFDSSDSDSIAESVEKVVRDRELRKELTEKGKKRLELFSWDKTVRQTIQLYESLF
ncbi:MAG: glycosyltransferase family 4 protein [Dysgonamonadaceae bacterium]|jgi:glycosyltransferase involved in cell wall biosynthesis|nr:glycosyltransferase family 4 protein [Dysgonamonadaceae bacterium]